MDYEKILGPESYKEGDFFYELIENNKFSIAAFNQKKEDIEDYTGIIRDDDKIDKVIIRYLYGFMILFVWTISDFEMGKYRIIGIENSEKLFDYYEELDFCVTRLFL